MLCISSARIKIWLNETFLNLILKELTELNPKICGQSSEIEADVQRAQFEAAFVLHQFNFFQKQRLPGISGVNLKRQC